MVFQLFSVYYDGVKYRAQRNTLVLARLRLNLKVEMGLCRVPRIATVSDQISGPYLAARPHGYCSAPQVRELYHKSLCIADLNGIAARGITVPLARNIVRNAIERDFHLTLDRRTNRLSPTKIAFVSLRVAFIGSCSRTGYLKQIEGKVLIEPPVVAVLPRLVTARHDEPLSVEGKTRKMCVGKTGRQFIQPGTVARLPDLVTHDAHRAPEEKAD